MKLKMIWLSLFCVMFSAEAMKLKQMFFIAHKALQGQVRKHSIEFINKFFLDKLKYYKSKSQAETALRKLFNDSSEAQKYKFLRELDADTICSEYRYPYGFCLRSVFRYCEDEFNEKNGYNKKPRYKRIKVVSNFKRDEDNRLLMSFKWKYKKVKHNISVRE